MSTETKTIINTSLQGFMMDFQEHVQEGWEMDMQNPAGLFGVAYETGLVRTDKSIAALLKAGVDRPPVRSRADILADARAAKKAKQEAREGAQ